MLTRRTIERMRPNQMVSHYLTASYLYYHMELSPMTDDAFDLLSRQILAAWDSIVHQHKHLITIPDLMAGTLYTVREDQYPTIIRGVGKEAILPAWKFGEVRVVDCPALVYYEDCMSGEMVRRLEPYLHPVGYVAPVVDEGVYQANLFE